MKKLSFLAVALLVCCGASAQSTQTKAQLIINADQGQTTISRHIYGHFSEHLGTCIYGGLWVGEDSKIPNTAGVRNDIIDALRHIQIPNLRWPGGCFADEYHWRDGIGPREERPQMINTHWGGVVENNAFGTHEFLNLCEVLGTEPYICGNVGSGSVEEMSKWVEYMTFDGQSPMADLRRQNGRDKPWKVQYWGVGNENWGCGGNMTAEFYADQYRRYATYARNYGDNRLFKIVGGPNTADYHWMEVAMRDIPAGLKSGVSLHYYSVPNVWSNKGSAYEFGPDEYYRLMGATYYMEELVSRHATVMDRYDPEKRVGLIVDEWGAWYDPHPGSNPGFLQQQNTLRDALVAGINLNIFNNHADRVKMANIAQLVNVLQALFMTQGDQMILTPTYYIFDMYKVHQDATLLPMNLTAEMLKDDRGRPFPQVSASASIDKNGVIHLSLVNTDLTNAIDLACTLTGAVSSGKASGQIVTAKNATDHNTFADPNRVVMYDFSGFQVKDGQLSVKLPAMSVVTIAIPTKK